MTWPNAKETAAAGRRLKRLKGPFGTSVRTALALTDQALNEAGKTPMGLDLRTGFAYQTSTGSGSSSDRRVPAREDRPPAARVSSSKGAALRLYLAAIADWQIRARAGTAFRNTYPIFDKEEPSWTRFVASTADWTRSAGGTHLTPEDKRRRTLDGALQTLKDAGLVHFPNGAQAKGKYEKFVILDDEGSGVEYSNPRLSDETFMLPIGFVTNGWLHVLEDSEILLLLMVACGRGREPFGEGVVAMSGETRLLSYGIARDPFTTAHRALEQFGLLHVEPVDRWPDGRAMGRSQSLHRLSMVAAGFEENALGKVRDTLNL